MGTINFKGSENFDVVGVGYKENIDKDKISKVNKLLEKMESHIEKITDIAYIWQGYRLWKWRFYTGIHWKRILRRLHCSSRLWRYSRRASKRSRQRPWKLVCWKFINRWLCRMSWLHARKQKSKSIAR